MIKPRIGQYLNFRVLNVTTRPDRSVELRADHPLLKEDLVFIYDPRETPEESEQLWNSRTEI